MYKFKIFKMNISDPIFKNNLKTQCIEAFTESVAEIRNSNEYPKFDITINGHQEGSGEYKIFIKGNKVAGDDYYINGWKKIPLFSYETNAGEPILKFMTKNSSENIFMDFEEIKKEMKKSIIYGISDFIEIIM